MLVEANKNDIDFFYGLYMHPSINPFLLYEPMPVAEFEPIFENLLQNTTLLLYQHKGQNVGMGKLVSLTYRSSHIKYLGGVAIAPAFAGQGHGSKMLEEIIVYVKALGCTRLELSTATFNAKAISLYKKVGFEEEGILRNYCYLKSEGRYIDEVMMSLLL